VSNENVEIVRSSIERWSAGDLEGFLANVDPELEWRTPGLYPGVDAVYCGHEGFRKF
jgi:ketosteroid isomerase-like protein